MRHFSLFSYKHRSYLIFDNYTDYVVAMNKNVIPNCSPYYMPAPIPMHVLGYNHPFWGLCVEIKTRWAMRNSVNLISELKHFIGDDMGSDLHKVIGNIDSSGEMVAAAVSRYNKRSAACEMITRSLEFIERSKKTLKYKIIFNG